MDTRALIGILLIFFIYITFLMPRGVQRNQAIVGNSVTALATTPSTSTPAVVNGTKATLIAPDEASKLRNTFFELKNELVLYKINGLGSILTADFLKYAQKPRSKETQKEDFGDLGLNRTTLNLGGSEVKWTVDTQSDSQIILKGASAVAQVRRTIVLAPDSYFLTFRDEIKNTSAQTEKASLAFDLHRLALPATANTSWVQRFTRPNSNEVHDFISFQDGKVTRQHLMSVKDALTEQNGLITSAGFGEKYFFYGAVPTQFSIQQLQFLKNPDLSYDAKMTSAEKQIPPGESSEFLYNFYVGAKEIPQLKKASPELQFVVDYGDWLGPIARFLLGILIFFHSVIPNYGIGIILLTILVKMALFPLAKKSATSMRKMQMVQPKMNELKVKHKEDKARLNAEMMNLYKTEKVNPVGGCLPLVVQMPVFFALYRVFFSSIELRHAPFMLWIQDLSAHDPFFVTPILMTALMWYQQKLTPQPPSMDDTDAAQMQRTMMKYMPVIFGAIMIFLPAGLTLYFLVNALISILQQVYLNKQLGAKFPLPQKVAV